MSRELRCSKSRLPVRGDVPTVVVHSLDLISRTLLDLIEVSASLKEIKENGTAGDPVLEPPVSTTKGKSKGRLATVHQDRLQEGLIRISAMMEEPVHSDGLSRGDGLAQRTPAEGEVETLAVSKLQSRVQGPVGVDHGAVLEAALKGADVAGGCCGEERVPVVVLAGELVDLPVEDAVEILGGAGEAGGATKDEELVDFEEDLLRETLEGGGVGGHGDGDESSGGCVALGGGDDLGGGVGCGRHDGRSLGDEG